MDPTNRNSRWWPRTSSASRWTPWTATWRGSSGRVRKLTREGLALGLAGSQPSGLHSTADDGLLLALACFRTAESQFGAVLDMVTDRCMFVCLYACIAHPSPCCAFMHCARLVHPITRLSIHRPLLLLPFACVLTAHCRTATAGLCMVNLAVEKCELRKFGWIGLVMLDIGSHWAHCMRYYGHACVRALGKQQPPPPYDTHRIIHPKRVPTPALHTA